VRTIGRQGLAPLVDGRGGPRRDAENRPATANSGSSAPSTTVRCAARSAPTPAPPSAGQLPFFCLPKARSHRGRDRLSQTEILISSDKWKFHSDR
jgi:hypothetical protein